MIKLKNSLNGGVKRDRTADLLNAIQALSQLSYNPNRRKRFWNYLFPVAALCVWGGPVLAAFSYAMLVGIVAGTYSSIFVATGSLIEWWLQKPE